MEMRANGGSQYEFMGQGRLVGMLEVFEAPRVMGERGMGLDAWGILTITNPGDSMALRVPGTYSSQGAEIALWAAQMTNRWRGFSQTAVGTTRQRPETAKGDAAGAGLSLALLEWARRPEV